MSGRIQKNHLVGSLRALSVSEADLISSIHPMVKNFVKLLRQVLKNIFMIFLDVDFETKFHLLVQ